MAAKREYASARIAKDVVASVPVNEKIKPYLAEAAKDGRDGGLLASENTDRLYSLDEELPEYALLVKAVEYEREVNADCDRFLASKRRAVEEAEAKGDRMAKLEAESALNVAVATTLKERAEAKSKVKSARLTWTDASNRNAEKRKLAGHLDCLPGFLAGEPIDTTYRSNIGAYAHPTVDLCRWLVNAPAGVAAILAKEAIASGALPYNERVAEVRAEYLRADEYRLACNRDRNPYPHVTYGIKTVQLEVDQVSTDQLDAKCAELGRVPKNEEICALYAGPGKDEAYRAQVAADAEARRNSTRTKQLQQQAQEMAARRRPKQV